MNESTIINLANTQRLAWRRRVIAELREQLATVTAERDAMCEAVVLDGHDTVCGGYYVKDSVKFNAAKDKATAIIETARKVKGEL